MIQGGDTCCFAFPLLFLSSYLWSVLLVRFFSPHFLLFSLLLFGVFLFFLSLRLFFFFLFSASVFLLPIFLRLSFKIFSVNCQSKYVKNSNHNHANYLIAVKRKRKKEEKEEGKKKGNVTGKNQRVENIFLVDFFFLPFHVLIRINFRVLIRMIFH